MQGPGSLRVLALVSFVAAGCAYNANQHASRWLIVDTEHIRVRTNVSSKSAVKIASELQAIRDAFAGTVFRCAFAGNAERFPITVLSRGLFRDVAPKGIEAYYHKVRTAWLAEYGGQVIVPDDLSQYAAQRYQHQLAHHLISLCLPAAPAWLTEGLAGLLETAAMHRGKVRIGLPPYAVVDIGLPASADVDGIHVLRMPRRRLPAVERIVAMTDLRNYDDSLDTMANHAAAWALVHLLEIGAADLRPRFLAYLAALQRPDADPEALFVEHFGDASLQDRLNDYLKRGRFTYYLSRTLPSRRIAARIRPMRPGEAHVHLAWLRWASADKDSRKWALEHLAAAKQDPSSRGRAHLIAAMNLATSGDLAAAEREVAEGLRATPNNPELLHAYIELLFARKRKVADIAAAALRLKPVARTADQVCTLSRAALALGDARTALSWAVRGRAMRPSSHLCRQAEAAARSLARS